MVVVVDPDLTAREELLVHEGTRRAPLPRGPPSALFAQEALQASEELVRRQRSPVGRIFGVTLTAQDPGEVVEEPPVGREIQFYTDPRCAVHALDVVGRMAGRKGCGPAEVAFGSQRETDSHLHGPQILTHATRNCRSLMFLMGRKNRNTSDSFGDPGQYGTLVTAFAGTITP